MEPATEILQGRLVEKGYVVTWVRGKKKKSEKWIQCGFWRKQTYLCEDGTQWVKDKCMFDVVLREYMEDVYMYSGRLGQKQYKDLEIR